MEANEERVYGHVVRDDETGEVIEIHLHVPKCMVANGESQVTILEAYTREGGNSYFEVVEHGTVMETQPCKLDYFGIELANDEVLAQLKRCYDVIQSVENYQQRIRLWLTLQTSLDALKRFGNAKLYLDFAPLSFGFSAGGLAGGLIFHGPTNGSGPNFSVHLDQSFVGWSLHT